MCLNLHETAVLVYQRQDFSDGEEIERFIIVNRSGESGIIVDGGRSGELGVGIR